MDKMDKMDEKAKTVGIVARFETPSLLLRAAGELRQAGYRKFDAHSPFPIHGMDEAMAEKRSRVSYFAAAGAILGGVGLLTLIWWVHTEAYPLIISGKAFFSYQAFFPPIFAICVLSAAFGALISFAGLIDLRFHHPLFESDLFTKFSDDGFIIAIESTDPKFQAEGTSELLKSLGASQIELVEGE